MQAVGSLKLKDTRLGEKRGIQLINSSSPWASDLDDLKLLYESRYTAAVTTRTAVVTVRDATEAEALEASEEEKGKLYQSAFVQDASVHAHSFLRDSLNTLEGGKLTIARGSLNSYGYSPHSLSSYLRWSSELYRSDPVAKKPIILSITGPAQAVQATIVFLRRWIAREASETGASALLGVEINLSCPNIKGNDAPSGYDGSSIAAYVAAARQANLAEAQGAPQLSIGLKLPPYTYQAQFQFVIDALCSAPTEPATFSPHPISFLTSTNTLGCSFWLNEGEGEEKMIKALPSSGTEGHKGYDGTGGLAGESLHPISLGNVFKLSNMLKGNSDKRLASISIVGVGGVMSGLSASRMRSAGADVVGLATALGRQGIEVFDRISSEVLEALDSESDY